MCNAARAGCVTVAGVDVGVDLGVDISGKAG